MDRILKKCASFGLKSFPVSFWSYTNLGEHGKHMTEAEVESWADAGFTVPQSPGFDPKDPAQKAHIVKLLDWAHQRGMKLIVCDPRAYVRTAPDGKVAPDYADGVKAAVADFGKHPGLLGFHVGDEPGAEIKEAFFACYKTQNEIAPHLHPYANLLPHFPGIEARAGTDSWPNYLDEYVKKSDADMLGYDCYAQMNPGDSGWHDYYRNLRLYREAAVRYGVPFWNTLLSVGHFKYRCPNQDEIRWQFNTSIAAGANGISWFFYYMRAPELNFRMSPVDEHWNRTQTYEDVRRVQKSFHRRYGDLFNRIACTRVSFFPHAYGGGDVFQPNEIVASIRPDGCNTHPILLGEFVDVEGGRYVMLVNNSMTESERVKITFRKNVRWFSWDWNGREHEGGAYCKDFFAEGTGPEGDGIAVWHWLAPGQEAVYRVQIGT
ncbi:MAG: hypothetical protein NTV86_02420 [Planctomycetota bacterium]|nr:hypothetical protein [Planctomycetota bacterium]